jgi:hypothetical protein
MSDMKAAIIPKSDQLNADDLLSGPITITISRVEIRPGGEQPVSIFYQGDNGKPYKPCKSMCRVLVMLWGADSSQYVGRSATLYCDPLVKWGGMAVGGIRISHMSDIAKSETVALTVTRANKKPYTVKPLIIQPGEAKTSPAPEKSTGGGPGATAPPFTSEQMEPFLEAINEALDASALKEATDAALGAATGIKDRDAYRAFSSASKARAAYFAGQSRQQFVSDYEKGE